ncbi:MAG: hypothetical protein HQ575_06450, partial [Candidatus Omnitrophica bacterium]|nr:hypothetical protein [Candidatus Omnitrophota bacterium]
KIMMKDIEGPILLDIAPFAYSAALYVRGYEAAGHIIENLIHKNALLLSYKDFRSLMQSFHKRREECKRLSEEDETAADFMLKDLGREADYTHTFFKLLLPEVMRAYAKRFLLETDIDIRTALNLLREIVTGRSGTEKDEWVDLLWNIYLDAENTSEENKHFLEILLTEFKEHYEIETEETLWKIYHIFKERDINRTYKAIDLLLRLKIKKEDSNTLFMLMEAAYYKKEVVAAFCLLNTALYGTEEEYLHRGVREDAGPVVDCLGPELRNIYYYLLRTEEARKSGGALRSDAANRILFYTTTLDNFGSYPGSKGYTWFSALRNRTHQRPSRQDLTVVRTALYFWKELDDDILGGTGAELITRMKEVFSEEKRGSYSSLINRMLERLHSSGEISALEGGSFLDEILNIPEDRVIEVLRESNPNADETDLEKMEYMIRLYYALNEYYGVVGATIIPKIKGIVGEDEYGREVIRGNMARLVEFMKEDYSRLISVIDTDNYRQILSAVASCRTAIRHRLLFENADDMEKAELMDLDHNIFLLGKHMIERAFGDIQNCESPEDLKSYVGLLVSMGKFMLASGLGGVDFEQFIYELERGRIKYSQLHDLTRALRTEVHKVTRKINENMRFAAEHIWENAVFYKFTEEWQGRLKTEKKKDKWGNDVNVVTEEDGREAEGYIIDNLIRDTGITLFDDALTRFNDILQAQLTPDDDGYISEGEEPHEVILDDQFFRFGQPEVIPREPLLSMWSKKGLNLVKMTQEDFPVPPGVILSAGLITRPHIFKSEPFKKKTEEEIELIRKYSKYPDLKLLLYARSGSAFMLPGLLVTIPNLGMNDKEAGELAALTGDVWFAYDTYAEFIRAYAIHILGIPEEYFQEVLNIYEKDSLSGDQMKKVCQRYKEIVALHGKGQMIPETMIDQVMMAVDCVYASWDSEDAREYRARHRISQEWGTVVILQKGVFGNLNPTQEGRISGTGVASLRMLPDGREVVQGKFRFRSIGDQLMSRADQNYVLLSNSERVLEGEQTLEELQPEVYKEILHYAHELRTVFGNNQMFEFTVELNKAWITQTNDDLVKDDYPEFVDSPDNKPIARGHGVSGGALRGWAANSFESAEKLLERYNAENPQDVDGVILFLDRVNPEMINRIPKGVHIIARIISVHAETLAQKYGITTVYGISDMRFEGDEGVWYIGSHKMEDGTTISMDGHENQLIYHNSGKIYLGSLPIAGVADGRIEIERRTPRALDRIRELREEEQAMAIAEKAAGITLFEREILAQFEKYIRGEIRRDRITRYLVNYRGILDKIARHCESLDFELYGEKFKGALTQRLAEWGVSFELFMNLKRNYHPRGEAHRKILENIDSRLNYEPPKEVLPTEITAYDKKGNEVIIKGYELLNGEYKIRDYFIIHPPKRDIKLVSFDFDGVLERMLNSYDDMLELFKTLRSLGLKIAITASRPGILNWFHYNPELKEYVDYCYEDPLWGTYLGRYVEELGLEPGQIMHFGNSWNYGLSFEGSHVAGLHEGGFVTVMVDDKKVLRTGDIMKKRVDAVMLDMSTGGVLDLVKHWINLPEDDTEVPPIGLSPKMPKEPVSEQVVADAEFTMALLLDILHSKLPNGARRYEVRYDEGRLSNDPLERLPGAEDKKTQCSVVEEYIRILKSMATREEYVKAVPFNSNTHPELAGKPVISIVCTVDGKDVGAGHIQVPEDRAHLLKVAGAMNMALALACIPRTPIERIYEQYSNYITFLCKQYEAMTGKKFTDLQDVIIGERIIRLDLPDIIKEDMDLYNRRAIEILSAV